MSASKIIAGLKEVLDWPESEASLRVHLPTGETRDMTFDEYCGWARENMARLDGVPITHEEPKHP